MRINHIGMVVSSLSKSTEFYTKNFDYEIKVKDIYVKNQGVNITMLRNQMGGPDLELITPENEDSPSYNALKKRSVLNHICYETENYEEVLAQFNSKIVRPSMPAPVELFGGGRTFFAYIGGSLTEFVELV
jgi:catechol 2,3-dioxygenase-like lactoylglutathione lyase family enzyme